MTIKEQDARYYLQKAKECAKSAVAMMATGDSPDEASMSAVAVVDACDNALRELDLRIRAGEQGL